MVPVAFVGDINVDLLMGGLARPPAVDREVTCESFEVAMGSTAVIAACVYSFLGGRARFFGLAGADDYGRFMLRGMEECGIDTRFVRHTDRVRTGVTVNLIHGSTRTQVTYPGTIRELEPAHIDHPALFECRHVHFSGVFLQEKLRGGLAGLLGEAKGRGISASLDCQWDPAGQWRGLEEWLPLLDVFFCNGDEARSITGEGDAEAACRALARRTARPLVKLGAGGALFTEGGRVVRVPARAVEVVDTTGAGDSFDAAFLFATLEQGLELKPAVRFAVAAGTRCCLFRGGTGARSTLRDILDIYEP
jgi:sugar/nucleoside kinase (ribokinase family)